MGVHLNLVFELRGVERRRAVIGYLPFFHLPPFSSPSEIFRNDKVVVLTVRFLHMEFSTFKCVNDTTILTYADSAYPPPKTLKISNPQKGRKPWIKPRNKSVLSLVILSQETLLPFFVYKNSKIGLDDHTEPFQVQLGFFCKS